MKRNDDRNGRRMMKLVSGILGVVLAFSGLAAWAQAAPSVEKPTPNSVRTFYLTNVSRTEDATEILTAIRNMLEPRDKVYFVPSQNAIVISAPPDQIVLAQKILGDLDRLKKSYRLTYTITEKDGGKRIGSQHFSMIVVAGGRTTLKQGSKVPVVTGINSGGASSQTQMTYLDVGMNFDASLDEFVDGVRLRTKVEQSGLGEVKSAIEAQDPVVRQTVLEGTSILAQDKPLVLGSLDIPGSTRHLDVEVVLEAVK